MNNSNGNGHSGDFGDLELAVEHDSAKFRRDMRIQQTFGPTTTIYVPFSGKVRRRQSSKHSWRRNERSAIANRRELYELAKSSHDTVLLKELKSPKGRSEHGSIRLTNLIGYELEPRDDTFPQNVSQPSQDSYSELTPAQLSLSGRLAGIGINYGIADDIVSFYSARNIQEAIRAYSNLQPHLARNGIYQPDVNKIFYGLLKRQSSSGDSEALVANFTARFGVQSSKVLTSYGLNEALTIQNSIDADGRSLADLMDHGVFVIGQNVGIYFLDKDIVNALDQKRLPVEKFLELERHLELDYTHSPNGGFVFVTTHQMRLPNIKFNSRSRTRDDSILLRLSPSVAGNVLEADYRGTPISSHEAEHNLSRMDR
ncbi:hypothetical protein HYX06_00965 [Candidatus Woesearchaeota archaeon]|nr:hypothetical protein [Candidatus Woesearchaeota archaeon]